MTARARVEKDQGSRSRKEERLRVLAESAIRARRFTAEETLDMGFELIESGGSLNRAVERGRRRDAVFPASRKRPKSTCIRGSSRIPGDAMTDLAILHQLADDLARKDHNFNVKKGPGRGDKATGRYMEKLNKAAKRRMGKGVRIEKPVMKGTRLTFDFFLPRERTAVEVSLHRFVSEFEKDLLKALLAKHHGTPIRKLAFFTRVEGRKVRDSPSARAEIRYMKAEGIEVTFLPLRSRRPA